jgi:hypothetical protein
VRESQIFTTRRRAAVAGGYASDDVITENRMVPFFHFQKRSNSVNYRIGYEVTVKLC